MTFPELKDLLFSLSNIAVFREEMQGFLDYHDPYSTGTEAHLGKTIVFDRDPQSGEERQVTLSYDRHIYDLTVNVLSRPTEIYKSISHEKKAEQLQSWIEDLQIAIKLVDTNPFYQNFLQYRKALGLTSEILLKMIERLELRNNKRGNPNWKGLSVREKARVISYARELLDKEPETYRPRAGANVSECLKDRVADGLSSEIPGITRHKVANLLSKYPAQLKT